MEGKLGHDDNWWAIEFKKTEFEYFQFNRKWLHTTFLMHADFNPYSPSIHSIEYNVPRAIAGEARLSF